MLYTKLLSTLLKARMGTVVLDDKDTSDESFGLALVADGIGGLDLCATSLKIVAANDRRLPRVKTLSWGHGFGRWLADLTDRSHHEIMADEIARVVQSFRQAKPNEPVYLIGKSGGTGLVVWALERLPENSIETVVLLAPALSTGYDLSLAARAVRREIVVFWSPLDFVILGLGTRIFGTVDGVRAVAAGLRGFRLPLNDPLVAKKLRQVRWHPEMARTGYLGGHIGPDLPGFLKRYVAPLLTAQKGESIAGSSPARSGPIT